MNVALPANGPPAFSSCATINDHVAPHSLASQWSRSNVSSVVWVGAQSLQRWYRKTKKTSVIVELKERDLAFHRYSRPR